MRRHELHDVRPLALTAAALVALGCLAACSGDSAGSDGQRARMTTAAPVPRVGTCWDVPARKAMRRLYAHGDTAVPCDRPHTTETVFASALPDATPRTAMEQFGTLCFATAREYVGQDVTHWTPVQGELYVPPARDTAGGAAWVRCDVVKPRGPRTAVAQTLHASVADAARLDRAGVWACVPSLNTFASTAFVPCTRRHAYEASGRLLLVPVAQHRPSAAQLRRAERPCARDVRGRPGLATDVVWDTRVRFHQLAGFCWIHREDGRLLPPIR